MEDMKELMDGQIEISLEWMNRLSSHSEMVGRAKRMRSDYLKKVQFADTIEMARFYMNCYNQASSLLMYYRDSVSFDKRMLKEWIK